MHMRMIHEREENGLGTQPAIIVCNCGERLCLDDDEATSVKTVEGSTPGAALNSCRAWHGHSLGRVCRRMCRWPTC